MQKNYTLEQIAELSSGNAEFVDVTVQENTTIRVRTRLTLVEKVSLIEELVKACSYDFEPYLNPLKLKILTAIKVLEMSTDIAIIVTGEEDIYEVYDILKAAGIINEILPYTDYQEIVNWAYESAESFKNYQNSLVGIFDEIKNKFNEDELKNLVSVFVDEMKDNPELKALLSLYESENVLEESN